MALGGLGMHPTPLSRQDRVGSTPLCDVCQFTVKTVESLLENNVTEVSPIAVVCCWGAGTGCQGAARSRGFPVLPCAGRSSW